LFLSSENGWKLQEKREQLRKEMEEKKQKQLPVVIIDTPVHNPFPPIQIPNRPSIERPVCSFYLKTGVCRYNERFAFSLSPSYFLKFLYRL
jgi:hypothetical protein